MKSRIQQIIKLAVFTSICLTLLLLVCEYAVTPIVYRQVHIPSRDLALLGFLAAPNMLIDDTMTNSQGFTGDVIDNNSPRSANSIRILTLGSSILFNHRITEQLSAKLAKITSHKIELVGGALRAHTSRSDVVKYQYFRRFNFNYVLIYEGLNDLWANNVSAQDYRPDYSHVSAWNKRNLILDHSLLARYVYNTFIWRQPDKVLNGANFRADIDFEQNLRKLVRSIKSDHGVPLLMTFAWHLPLDYSKEKFWANQLSYYNPTDYDKWEVELWGRPTDVRTGLNRLNKIIRRIAADEKVLLLDQEKLFWDKSKYFSDISHLNDDGTTQFAENIRNFIETNNVFSSYDGMKKLHVQ
jgi:lysophospholipase L1-like esterase